MQNITEVISNEGVRSTTGELEINKRLMTPHPGDPVIFESNEYPFNHEFGRIDGVRHCEKGEITIICQDGSVFLNKDGSVSISGGPFETVKISDLLPLSTLKAVNFWNWGNNRAGANKGVHYTIDRPLFLLKK